MLQNIKPYIYIVMLTLPNMVVAAQECEKWIAKMVSTKGRVEKQRLDQDQWRQVEKNEYFCQGDRIRTQKHSRVTLELGNESLVTLEQRSALTFPIIDKGSFSWLLELFQGSAFFRSRSPHQLKIDTPFVNAVHEGTEFMVTVNEQQTEISVFDGRVAAENQAGRVQIDKGQIGIAAKGQITRVQALTIHPKDAVQWALYYPPIIDYQSLGSMPTIPAIQQSLNFYQQGDVYQALSVLDNIPEQQQDEHYLALKASLLLTVGSVDEAFQEIDRAQQLKATGSTASAIKAIIAVTKNHGDQALKLAQKATELNPSSAVAKIALSYAYQATFKIPEALEATEQAVKLAPNNALAWARLSELQLSSGERSDALESANKAQLLNPQLDRTQTILGFANLAQIDIDEAKTAFTQAIDLNSADPLARLGLGLAKIRKGAVEEGARDLETAVSLDPDNAIMRSYLGKAYYELKNKGYAATELAIAKEMDPNDPTPWFYDAILKQTTNRPVEALHDMQKAIELNDNRGVYRSKLLLDEDAAAKSANMARIYQDLGFSRVALKEAWNALGHDSTNHSAHRFLADTLQGRPRQRIARASELLQAQLLQPINITPVEPQLTSENIGILNSTGPGSLSVNEYDPLFNANGAHIVLNGAYGSNNTKTNNAIISGVYDRLSMSLGQFHFQTDGFRENDDYQQNIYDAFVQYAFTPEFNVQIELKSEHVRAGDLPLRLNEFHRENRRETVEQNTARIGGHYKISPGHDFIASFIYTEREDNIKDKFVFTNPNPFQENIDISSDSTENKGHQTEIQYLFHSSSFDITAGFSYLNLKNTKFSNIVNSFILPPPDPLTTTEQLQTQTHHYTGYVYSKLYLLPNLTTILGLSFDSLNNSLISFDSFKKYSDGFIERQESSPTLIKRQQFNPKFGIIWNPVKSLTLRGAVFRTLKRQLAANQTIEPTQVAGFNQFVDDNNGTTAWRYGFGLDYNHNNTLFMGGEVSWRETKQPFTSNGVLSNQTRDESSHLAYVYWAPTEWVSFRSEYRFDLSEREFETGKGNNILPQSVTTHQVPLSVNFFLPKGLFAKISGTYINQRVSSVRDDVGLDYQSEDFWIFDTSIGFRLPKRIGVISLEVNNLFNREFNYQSTFDASGPQLSPFIPERQVSLKLTLSY